jgi:hypothetical protein
MRNLSFLLVIVPVAVAACSSSSTGAGPGGSSGSLDCTYLESSNNCWKTTFAAASSCLPPAGAQGVLSADNKTCTYSTGQVVTFDQALSLPLPQQPQPTFNFTMSKNGADCFRFQEPSSQEFSMKTSGGTAQDNGAGGVLTLTCPDTSSYSSSNGLALLSCEGGLADLPGTTWSSGPTSVTFGLIGVGPTASTVIDCAR